MGNVVPMISRFADGIANLYSRLGTTADRGTKSVYWVPPLNQQQIEAAYRSSWLTRKVHDLPAFEMTRAGRDWQASKEQIEALEKAEAQFQLWPKLFSALVTAKLHGGAAIIMGVRQGMPNQPLRPETLTKNSLRYLFVVSRHQLQAPRGFDTDVESDYYGHPLVWELRGAKGNGVEIHPSRVITFHGTPLPPGCVTTSQLDQFWGDPFLISLKSVIDNAETSQAAVATLLHEMKQDVISIPGLTESIATQGSEDRIAARIEALNRFKSMFSALLLDRGDGQNEASGEKWETRQLSFAQHPELLDTFIGFVAGAADIPKTRLMGASPGGLQSTGKGEQDDFNRMIDSRRTAELTDPLRRIDDVLIRSTLGSRPAEVYYEFGPLEEGDQAAAAEIENKEAQTVKTYVDTGLIPPDALGKAVVNRLVESGRFPGLEKALDESTGEIGGDPEADAPDLPTPANENDVRQMEQRRAITRDQAMTLLTDASPRSLYVRRDLLNAAEFTRWAKAQGFTDIEDGLHVTIIYSRTPVDWMKVGSTWSGDDGKLTVPEGGARLIEKLGTDGAVVLLFSSWELSYRHGSMREAGASFDYDEYQPHVTITYQPPPGLDLRTVEPYRGKLEFGPEIFEEVDDAP